MKEDQNFLKKYGKVETEIAFFADTIEIDTREKKIKLLKYIYNLGLKHGESKKENLKNE